MELTNIGILEVNLLNGIESIKINTDEQIEQIVKALSSQTRRNILRQIQTEIDGLDVSRIASKLGMTEANISAQIKKLEKAGLIKCDYSSGQHGIRKISTLKYDKLTIAF
jgi:predicted transcriptional regulator